jgi:tight adherence protein C
MFYAARIALSAAAVLIGVIVIMPIMREMPSYITLLTVLFTALIGFFLPWFWVERAAEYRKMQIQDSFADVLDLLLVCIEAGHGFDQALNRIVRELETSNPVVTEELLVVTREMRAGKDRYQVLGDFAERTGIDDIKSFITVIKQADKFGVSIAQALRVYSHEMRDKRYSRAEEKANMLPMKLALGAILFTVPPAIIIMVGPSVIMVIQNLGTLL